MSARYTPADINRDCVVDIYDFVQLSNHWLQEEYLVTAQAPRIQSCGIRLMKAAEIRLSIRQVLDIMAP